MSKTIKLCDVCIKPSSTYIYKCDGCNNEVCFNCLRICNICYNNNCIKCYWDCDKPNIWRCKDEKACIKRYNNLKKK